MARDSKYRPPAGFVSKTGKTGNAVSQSVQVKPSRPKSTSRVKSTHSRVEITSSNRAQARMSPQRKFATFGIIGLIVLAAAAVGLYLSPLFTIEQVKVNGLSYLNEQHVLEQAQVSGESTVLRNDAAGIASRLKSNRYVADVNVTTELPNLLIIDVKERSLAAKAEITVDVTDSSLATWLVSSDSIWLDDVALLDTAMISLDNEQLQNLPTIRDVNKSVQSAQGLSISDQGLINAIAVLNQFTTGMRTNVKTISAPDVYNCTLTLKNNVLVAFGEAIDVPAKEKAIETALSQNSQLSSINVHVPRLTAVM